MCEDAGLVVGSPAAVEASVALGRYEGGRRPLGVRSRWRDVVVRVEEDGRGAGRSGQVADDGGMAIRRSEHPGVSADAAQQLGDQLGGCHEWCRIVTGGAHRGDADQALEIGADSRHARVDARMEIGRGHRWSIAPSSGMRSA